MLIKIAAVGVLALLGATNSRGQDTSKPFSIVGTWNILGTKNPGRFNFGTDESFQHVTIFAPKPGASTPATGNYEVSGAYKFKPAICSTKGEAGNLWIAAQSERCCFLAYQIGETLVLDVVGTSSIFGVCTNKTLRLQPSVTATQKK